MSKNPLDAVKIAREALEEKKAENIETLDLIGLSNIADYFVIANGSNENQLKAMAANVEEKLFKAGFKLNHSEGLNGSTWILLDYGDVLIHLFNREQREFYSLERIWGDAKKI